MPQATGTVEMVQRDFPHVELIANGSNLGFVRANSQAIRGGRSPYVLVLRPDTRVTSRWLERLST
jgi:GT2 family glycosyltransferase